MQAGGTQPLRELVDEELKRSIGPRTAEELEIELQAAQRKVGELAVKAARFLPIDSLATNPWRRKQVLAASDVEALAASIRENGLLHAIVVRKSFGGTFEIVDGERRWRACQVAGLTTVQVELKDVPDDVMVVLAASRR